MRPLKNIWIVVIVSPAPAETPVAAFSLETEAETLRYDLEDKGYKVYVMECPFAQIAEDVSWLYPSFQEAVLEEHYSIPKPLKTLPRKSGKHMLNELETDRLRVMKQMEISPNLLLKTSLLLKTKDRAIRC